jgi:hypothetical protein
MYNISTLLVYFSNTFFEFWDPDYKGKIGVNQYDHFLNPLVNARRSMDIDAVGVADTLGSKEIIWLQVKSDIAHSEGLANAYYANL